eukprot:gnl/MRDRNA2_/MRDRNA2_94399_c0_seq1.p1 gnl/MRDRNA2_/MRDRNA2_94399_c0~~gnl/MRDRNA2_/MRDRNA2_94399_c0_seq1.p1  ORF type:complete len:188 (+),score=48.50 gnl/MRDRNA2_/MRDRNA2_94399_c0_seq1:98-661(+)
MSGFFGVTALGPANPFTVNHLSALGVMHFSDEEFQEGFQLLDSANKGSIEKKQVFELLTAVYGFEPMPEEVDLFVNQFTLGEDGSLTMAEFQAGIDEMRSKLAGVTENATQYKSAADLRADRFKHRRVEHGPMNKFKTSMTTGQEIGWHEEEVFNERFPRQSCNETRYNDAVVASKWTIRGGIIGQR